MGNNLTLKSIHQEEGYLPHIAFVILLFFALLALISYVYFKDIVLVSEARPEDFEFKNFLIYNFGLKVILFPFKFIGMALLFMLGAFLFKIEHLKFISVLKVVILAELIKYLPEISKIIWFIFIAPESLEGYDLSAFNDYFSLNGLLGITYGESIYSLLNYFSLVEVFYVLGVAKLLQIDTNENFYHLLKWNGTTYFSFAFIMGLASTLISL